MKSTSDTTGYLPLLTERLQLRPVQESDAAALFTYRSDPEVNRLLTRFPDSEDEVLAFIQEASREFDQEDTWFQLVVARRADKQVVGDLGLHFMGPFNQQVELGYTFAKAEQGKGYAREAIAAVLNLLFLVLQKHRVTASIDPRNEPSIRLVEHLGFRREAYHRESFYVQGEWLDDLVYAQLRWEWSELQLPTSSAD